MFLGFSREKFMKICSKTHQIAPLKNFPGEACHRTPIATACLRHASQAASRYATRPASIKLGTPWQIIHTPMDYY